MSTFEPKTALEVVASDATLIRLSGDIRAEHEAVGADLRSAVHHAIRAGELLTQAKKAAPHGTWLEWLEAQDLGFSQQTANAYMRLWANYGTSRNLPPSINAALKQISRARPEPRRVEHDPPGGEPPGDGGRQPPDRPADKHLSDIPVPESAVKDLPPELETEGAPSEAEGPAARRCPHCLRPWEGPDAIPRNEAPGPSRDEDPTQPSDGPRPSDVLETQEAPAILPSVIPLPDAPRPRNAILGLDEDDEPPTWPGEDDDRQRDLFAEAA